jgi:hypothetical protein
MKVPGRGFSSLELLLGPYALGDRPRQSYGAGDGILGLHCCRLVRASKGRAIAAGGDDGGLGSEVAPILQYERPRILPPRKWRNCFLPGVILILLGN